jgi:hypothetical protein
MRSTVSASSFTVQGVSPPMLNTWFFAASISTHRAMAGIVSATYEKARVCMPSPNTLRSLPAMIWFMKMPTTLRYRSPMCWYSP